jgi:hypothetical protein
MIRSTSEQCPHFDGVNGLQSISNLVSELAKLSEAEVEGEERPIAQVKLQQNGGFECLFLADVR